MTRVNTNGWHFGSIMDPRYLPPVRYQGNGPKVHLEIPTFDPHSFPLSYEIPYSSIAFLR